ncbi:MAG: hypothetical protein EU541_01855 [Promethearchaeota archaeon]|nr:MAG: hypothetical protein EU541_01855 [Candidatus Lokiarchaeota archaeon]
MEIFNKFKNYFSTSIENLKELEKELMELQNQFKSGFIAVFGFGGRVKGLPLIYKAENKDRIKKISAKFVNTLNSVDNLLSTQSVENLNIRFTENIIHYRRVNNEIGIIALIEYGRDIDKVKDWIGDHLSNVKALFR